MEGVQSELRSFGSITLEWDETPVFSVIPVPHQVRFITGRNSGALLPTLPFFSRTPLLHLLFFSFTSIMAMYSSSCPYCRQQCTIVFSCRDLIYSSGSCEFFSFIFPPCLPHEFIPQRERSNGIVSFSCRNQGTDQTHLTRVLLEFQLALQWTVVCTRTRPPARLPTHTHTRTHTHTHARTSRRTHAHACARPPTRPSLHSGGIAGLASATTRTPPSTATAAAIVPP